MEFAEDAVERAQNVRMIIFDVDGVLTEGGIYIGAEGELFKSFYCRDGLAIRLARKSGLKTAIITGRSSRQVEVRAKSLEIDGVWQGYMDKREAYAELKQKFSLSDNQIAYIGDDLIDLPAMVKTGFSVAVADAAPEVRDVAHLITDLPGGRGAVRQAVEFILKSQGKWAAIVESYKK